MTADQYPAPLRRDVREPGFRKGVLIVIVGVAALIAAMAWLAPRLKTEAASTDTSTDFAFGDSISEGVGVSIAINRPYRNKNGGWEAEVVETNQGRYPYQVSSQTFTTGDHELYVTGAEFAPLYPNRTWRITIPLDSAPDGGPAPVTFNPGELLQPRPEGLTSDYATWALEN